jgi:ribosomal protein S5
MDKRRARNRARYQLEKEGLVSVGDGKDVAHKTALSKGGSNARSNLKAEAAGANRSFARNGNHSLKSEVSKRERKKK